MKDNVNQAPIVELAINSIPEPLIETIDISNDTFVTTYKGYAPLGTKTSESKWFIVKTVVDTIVSGTAPVTTTTTTTTTYPKGEMSYNQVWDDRATLNYAR